MKNSIAENEALSRVALPRATKLELETIDYLKKLGEYSETRDEVKAREEFNKLYSMLGTDAEAVQAAHWNALPLAVRRVAVMSANMSPDRADDTLNKFNAFERGRINLCFSRFIAAAETVSKCMRGGEIKAPTDKNFH